MNALALGTLCGLVGGLPFVTNTGVEFIYNVFLLHSLYLKVDF